MEKISGILPASSRVSSVDLSEAPSIRPGAPAPKRSIPTADTFSVSPMARWKSKDMHKAGIVNQVTDTFFHNRIDQGLAVGTEEPAAPVAPQREIVIIPIEVPVFDDEIESDGGGSYTSESGGVDGYSSSSYPEEEYQPQLDIYG